MIYYHKFGGCVVLEVNYEGERFVDPDVYPLYTAWMLYSDIPPEQLRVCY